MYDLISIGSISVDLYFKGNSLTYKDNRFQLAIGGKYQTDFFHLDIGGGGANVAIGASKLGLKTAVIGKIGDNPFKKLIFSKLNDYQVSHSLCDIEKNYYNISSIFLSDKGERSIVHYSTPHQHLFVNKEKIIKMIKTKIIYLGNLPDVSITERTDLLHYLKKNQIKTIVNLGVKDCRRPLDQLKKFLNAVDILIINGHEFAELVKAPYKDIHFHEQVIKWYIPFLTDQIVIITEGEKGSFAYQDNQVFYQHAEKIDQVVDATGAGDGYTAAFIAEYLQSSDIKKAMNLAAKYSSKILGKIGAN